MEWRLQHGMIAEMKWKKVSANKFNEYKSFVDMVFEWINSGEIYFKTMVVDHDEVDYRTFHNGDKDLGFHKMYYQFLLHKFGIYAAQDGYSLLVRVDRRTNGNNSLQTLKDVLNNGIRKKHGIARNAVVALEAFDSKSSILFQFADVLMGAVGYHANDVQGRLGSAWPKKEMAAYIASKARLQTLAQATRWGESKFEIWRFRFRNEKRPGA